MNRRQSAGAIVALLLSVSISSVSTADPSTLEDPILPDAAAIESLPAIPAAKTSATHELATTRVPDAAAPAGSIGMLAIKAEDLIAPASRANGGLTIQREAVASLHTLAIDGQVYELAPVDQTIDEKFGLRILSARVLNVPNAYARFMVTWDGAIVGTLATPSVAYRIASVAPGKQAVYRLAPRDARRLRPAARADKLERRHVQLEQLAAIAPEMVMSSEQGGTLELIGGRLGKLAPGKVTPATLEPLLQSVSDLAFRSTVPEIRISNVVRRPAGGRIEFEQTIEGIPVAARNFIRLGPDGTVLELSTQFVDPARAQIHLPFISRQQALKVAEEAVERHLHKSLSSVELLNPTQLYYRVQPFEKALQLEYRIDLQTQNDGNWEVTIDAYGGDAVVTDPRMFANNAFGHWVCRDSSGTLNPVKCNEPGALIVWYAPYQGTTTCPSRAPMEPGNPCVASEIGPAHQALARANTVLEPIHAANPAYCCDILGGSDRMLDVNVNVGGTYPANRVAYDRPTQSILSGSSNTDLNSYEVVWHEFGHHIVHMYNPLIANSSNLSAFEGAFNEGIADTVSAAIAESVTGPDFSWEDDWIIGDGSQWPNIPVRNCKDPNVNFGVFATTPQGDVNHVRGVAICALFYRIQRDSGITPRRLLELVLNVIARLKDYDGNRVDLTDLRNAIFLSTTANEAALRTALDTNFTQMHQPLGVPPLPPNQPPPPGAPGRPVLSSTGFQCALLANGWATLWFIDWLPVPQASFYTIYVKTTFRPFPDDVDVVTQTDINVWAQGRDPSGALIQGHVFGNACNTVCGATSNQVPVSMLASCDR